MVPACGIVGVGLLGALRPEQQEVLPVYAGVTVFVLATVKNSVGVLTEVDALLCVVSRAETACCTDARSALTLALACSAWACASCLFLV